MLAYGFCIGPSQKYERVAKPALARVAPQGAVYERRGQSSIFQAYNSIMKEHRASSIASVPLVLMHEDVELLSDITGPVLEVFSDEDVAVVGAVGGRGVQSVRWSRSRETFGHAPDLVNGANMHSEGTHAVDIVDGLIMVLSSWAVHNLCFDERFTGFHAYDADFCMQARAAGKKVMVTDLQLLHHSKGGFGDVGSHRSADDSFRRKWDVPMDSFFWRVKRRLRNLEY